MNKLYILPFDHRSSFSKIILGTETPDKEQKQKLKEFKKIIFTGLLYSLQQKSDKKNYSILVDEEYGQDVIESAKKNKIQICLPVEKSGKDFLIFDYGKNFREHILKFNPDFVKVLIRYNTDNVKQNIKQLSVLAELKEFCLKNKLKTIVELLVPPTKNDLALPEGRDNFEKIRPQKTISSIREIKTVLKPSIWKLEGLDKNTWPEVIKETRGSKIILLGRGENDSRVRKWLKDASSFDSVIGFAIGRTIFIDSIKRYNEGSITSEQASKLISKKFLSFVAIWEKYKNDENQKNI